MNPQTLTELLLARRVAAGGVAIIDRDTPVTAAAFTADGFFKSGAAYFADVGAVVGICRVG